MSRIKVKNTKLREDTGTRIERILTEHLNLSVPEASKMLDYKNPSTLYQSINGSTTPHYEKLVLLADLFLSKTGNELDLHWLITGQGEAIYRERMLLEYDIIKSIKKMNAEQKSAFIALFPE